MKKLALLLVAGMMLVGCGDSGGQGPVHSGVMHLAEPLENICKI